MVSFKYLLLQNLMCTHNVHGAVLQTTFSCKYIWNKLPSRIPFLPLPIDRKLHLSLESRQCSYTFIPYVHT